MTFTNLHSVNISTRNNNQKVLANVVKTRDIPYFDLRLYVDEKPTMNGIFIDPVEFVWLKNEITSINDKKKHCKENRIVTIKQINDEVKISLAKRGQAKKSITITKEETLKLYKELDKIAKIIAKE
jgi:hypothetical protein